MRHVFPVYAGMNFLAACSIRVFTVLEARDPMSVVHWSARVNCGFVFFHMWNAKKDLAFAVLMLHRFYTEHITWPILPSTFSQL